VGIHTERPSQTKRKSFLVLSESKFPFAIQVAILKDLPGAVMVKKLLESSNPGNCESVAIVRWEATLGSNIEDLGVT
jgi:hypothetical protein